MEEKKFNLGFVELKNNDSSSPKVFVNFNKIVSIRRLSDITVIKMSNGDTIEVLETPEEIFNMIAK